MANEVAVLPPNVVARGVNLAQWNTLCGSLYPGAKVDSVLAVLDYCKARGLDPMKKPCHIVPMKYKDGDSWKWRDVVMPGIYELRTTAMRTGKYLGHSAPEYGPDIQYAGVVAPQWCEMVLYRSFDTQGIHRMEFPVRVYFKEVCGVYRKDSQVFANDRWERAPVQMMTKCCEAAGLREAFPDEMGGVHTDDEMYEKVIDATVIPSGAQESNGAGSGAGSANDGATVHPQRRSRKPAVAEPQMAVQREGGRPDKKDAEKNDATDIGNAPETKGPPAFEMTGDASEDLITESQRKRLQMRLEKAGIEAKAFCAAFMINSLAELPFDLMQNAINWIEQSQPGASAE